MFIGNIQNTDQLSAWQKHRSWRRAAPSSSSSSVCVCVFAPRCSSGSFSSGLSLTEGKFLPLLTGKLVLFRDVFAAQTRWSLADISNKVFYFLNEAAIISVEMNFYEGFYGRWVSGTSLSHIKVKSTCLIKKIDRSGLTNDQTCAGVRKELLADQRHCEFIPALFADSWSMTWSVFWSINGNVNDLWRQVWTRV